GLDADRLETRGWDSCDLRVVKLCNQVDESAENHFFKCRFTLRVWSNVKVWLGLHDTKPFDWQNAPTVKLGGRR
ncbi:hypothetical protein QYE76_042944, partial [Lolium multiflorum]